MAGQAVGMVIGAYGTFGQQSSESHLVSYGLDVLT